MELNYEEFKIKRLFINILLKKGKKNNSENIFKEVLIKIKKITKQKPNFILLKSIKNLSPKIKIINIPDKKRKKKINKYFLIFLNEEKQIKESILWLLFNSKKINLIDEIIKTYKLKSKSFGYKKKYYREIKKLSHNIKFNKNKNINYYKLKLKKLKNKKNYENSIINY